MKKDFEKPLDAAKSLLKETEKMNRRDFFAATGKVIIPTLGLLGLSLGFSRSAQAGCDFTCSGGCTGCEGVCGGCDGTCKNGCEGFAWGKSN